VAHAVRGTDDRQGVGPGWRAAQRRRRAVIGP
jgi:hypothetical protein